MDPKSAAKAQEGGTAFETEDIYTYPQNNNERVIEVAASRLRVPDAVITPIQMRQPIERSSKLANAITQTTTYQIDSSGTISRKTLLEFIRPENLSQLTPRFPNYSRNSFYSRPTVVMVQTPSIITNTITTTTNFPPPTNKKSLQDQQKQQQETTTAPIDYDAWSEFDFGSETSNEDPKNEENSTTRTLTSTAKANTSTPKPSNITLSSNFKPKSNKKTPNSKKPTLKGMPTTIPLPSLEDFLHEQYESVGITTESTTKVASESTTEFIRETTTMKSQPTTTIRTAVKSTIETNSSETDDDTSMTSTPIMATLHNRKYPITPAHPNTFTDDGPSTTSSTTPTVNNGTVFLPDDESTPSTINPELPKISSPFLFDVLRNTDLSQNGEGPTVTRTMTCPDGQESISTYKILSRSYAPPTLPLQTYWPSPLSPAPPIIPIQPVTNLSPIDNFLSKCNLQRHLFTQNKRGQVKRTFIDPDGQMLTVTFILSRVPKRPT